MLLDTQCFLHIDIQISPFMANGRCVFRREEAYLLYLPSLGYHVNRYMVL